VAELQRISPDWAGEPCIVAAPGPSLTGEVAHRCRMARLQDQWRVVAVQDAYRLMPWADAMYGCDDKWWHIHQDCAGFRGEKWSTHEPLGNDKLAVADKYGVRLVEGVHGSQFSVDGGKIAYGANSGFQGLNLALLKGCTRIVLVGFNLKKVNGQKHFFGDHPKGLHNREEFESFVTHFAAAAKCLPKGVKIVNATPDSALTCFKMMDLETALANDCLRRDRAEPDCIAVAGCAGA
jgi:hypothetical protein